MLTAWLGGMAFVGSGVNFEWRIFIANGYQLLQINCQERGNRPCHFILCDVAAFVCQELNSVVAAGTEKLCGQA